MLCCHHGQVIIWNAETLQRVSVLRHTHGVLSVCFASWPSLMAGRGSTATAPLVSVASTAAAAPGLLAPAQPALLTPAGQPHARARRWCLISGGADGAVRVRTNKRASATAAVAATTTTSTTCGSAHSLDLLLSSLSFPETPLDIQVSFRPCTVHCNRNRNHNRKRNRHRNRNCNRRRGTQSQACHSRRSDRTGVP